MSSLVAFVAIVVSITVRHERGNLRPDSSWSFVGLLVLRSCLFVGVNGWIFGIAG